MGHTRESGARVMQALRLCILAYNPMGKEGTQAQCTGRPRRAPRCAAPGTTGPTLDGSGSRRPATKALCCARRARALFAFCHSRCSTSLLLPSSGGRCPVELGHAAPKAPAEMDDIVHCDRQRTGEFEGDNAEAKRKKDKSRGVPCASHASYRPFRPILKQKGTRPLARDVSQKDWGTWGTWYKREMERHKTVCAGVLGSYVAAYVVCIHVYVWVRMQRGQPGT